MNDNELKHAGIKNMKWGQRRYQNPDGSWTPAGLARRRQQEGGGSNLPVARVNRSKSSAKEGEYIPPSGKKASSGTSSSSTTNKSKTIDGEFREVDNDKKSTSSTKKAADASKKVNDGELSTEEMTKRIKDETTKRTYKKMFDPDDPSDVEKMRKEMDDERTRREYKKMFPGEKSKLEKAKESIDSASDIANELDRMNKASLAKKRANKPRMDLSKLTDKELNDRINRELKERQYNDLFAPDNVSRGRQRLSNLIDNLGTGLTLAGSALSIALAFQQLKKK